MSTQHTPGPWYTEVVTKTETGMRATIVCARHDSHWSSGGRTIAEVGHWRDRLDPEADARLIETAPKLLEALEELITLADDGAFIDLANVYATPISRKLRTAIAEAKGE